MNAIIESLLENVKFPEYLNVFETIPERVQCLKSIKIESSKITGAGRGIMVLECVEPGETIVKIAKPLIAVVGDMRAIMENTCDNCFVHKDRDTGLATVPVSDKGLRHSACTGCHVVFYCSKTCQAEAWADHHNYECKALKRMSQLVTDNGEDSFVSASRVRLIVRMLQLRVAGKISDTDWSQIAQLHGNIDLAINDEEEREMLTGRCQLAQAIKDHLKTECSWEQIMTLLTKSMTNELAMSFHMLRPFTFANGDTISFNKRFSSFRNAGRALDPFVEMINHSCEPNTLWQFEGRELRIIAMNPISTGEEISISYISNNGDYLKRQETLKELWGFDCTCSLCQQGPLGMNHPSAGAFGAGIIELVKKEDCHDPETHELWKNVSAQLKDRAGYGVYPMRVFHTTLAINEGYLKNTKAALKHFLTIRYLIDPIHVPAIALDSRLDNLFNMLPFVYNAKSTDCDTKFLFFHLWAMRIKGLEQFYGADSGISRFEKNLREKLTIAREIGSTRDDAKFVVMMNRFLLWVGIPAQSEEQLLEL